MRGTSVPPAAVVQHQCHTELPTRPCRHHHSCHPFPRQPQRPGWQQAAVAAGAILWPPCLHATQAATPTPTRWSSHASINIRLCSCMLLCCCQTALSKPWGLGTHHMHYSCLGRWCGNLNAAGMQASHACAYAHTPSHQHCYPALRYGTRATVSCWVTLEQQLYPTCCGWSPPPSSCQLLAAATAQPALLEP